MKDVLVETKNKDEENPEIIEHQLFDELPQQNKTEWLVKLQATNKKEGIMVDARKFISLLQPMLPKNFLLLLCSTPFHFLILRTPIS